MKDLDRPSAGGTVDVSRSPQSILHVVHGFPPEFTGGTEFYVLHAALAQQAAGLRVAILSGSARSSDQAGLSCDEVSGLTVHRLRRSGLFTDDWDRSWSGEA